MKLKKNVFSIFLVVITAAFCLVFLPSPAEAEVSAGIANGTCGENLTWILNDAGTLTISGTGDMYDYQSDSSGGASDHPWYPYSSSVKTVVISDGVTSIGDNAFYNCDSLSSMTIPDSVTTIGEEAFAFSHNLASITFSDSVATIGKSAFQWCTGLTSVTFGENSQLTTIGNGAFLYCDSLTSVTIPDSVTSIGNSAFASCSGLTSVTIPDSVTSIGYCAFQMCTSLTDVYISDPSAWCKITFCSDDANPLNNGANLRSSGGSRDVITEVVLDSTVTEIPNFAFFGCSSLTSITIPDSVTSIGDDAFYYCNNLTDVYYGGTKEQWDSITIKIGNEVLKNATIYYKPIASGTCGENLTWTLDSEGTLTISGTGPMQDFGTGQALAPSPFYDRSEGINAVVIEDGVTSIGTYALYECSNIISVTIPASVTQIGDAAFAGCAGLDGIIVDKDNPNYCNDIYGALHTKDMTTILRGPGKKITNYAIPNTVTTISGFAFSGCASLTTVEIPNSVSYIGWYAFERCSNLITIVIPNSVTKIRAGTFEGCSALSSVTIPASVKDILSSAFGECDSLTNIYYGGTQAQWETLSIDEYSKEVFENAIIHYTYSVKNGWQLEDGKWAYYVDDVKATNCWKKDSTGWCYLGTDGYMVTNKWVKDSTGWCYVGANGYMVYNKWVKDSTGWCYVDASGYMVYNKWVKDSTGWCYVGANGYMVYNKWVYDGGYWYWIDGNGYMAYSRSLSIGGKTYHFNAGGVCTNP